MLQYGFKLCKICMTWIKTLQLHLQSVYTSSLNMTQSSNVYTKLKLKNVLWPELFLFLSTTAIAFMSVVDSTSSFFPWREFLLFFFSVGASIMLCEYIMDTIMGSFFMYRLQGEPLMMKMWSIMYMVYAYAFDVVYTLPIPTNVLRRSFGAYPPAWVWWHDDIIDGMYSYKYMIACVRGEDGTLVSNAHEMTRMLHMKDVVAKSAIEAALMKREILEAYQMASYGKILDDDYIWSYQSTCLYTLSLDFTDASMWDADDLMVDLSELWGRDMYKSQMSMYKNFGPYQRPFWSELMILGHEKYWWTEMPKQFWMYD